MVRKTSLKSLFKVKIAQFILYSTFKVQNSAKVMDSVIFSYKSDKDDVPKI